MAVELDSHLAALLKAASTPYGEQYLSTDYRADTWKHALDRGLIKTRSLEGSGVARANLTDKGHVALLAHQALEKRGATWGKENPRGAFKKKAQRDTERTQRNALRAKVREAEDSTRRQRSRSVAICGTAIKQCEKARGVYKESRRDRDAARELAREYRLIFRAERIREQGKRAERKRGGPSIHRVQESDDQVLQNIPPEFKALWEKVKGSIRGSSHASRTEVFLKYAEEHPAEVYGAIETPSDDEYAAAWEASSRRARANPGQLVAMGWLTLLELKDGRKMRLGRGNLLAYDPRKKTGGLVIVFDVKTSRARAPSSAVKEYKKTHWGDGGAWGISDGDAPEVTAKSATVGDLVRVIYTTKKGGDRALTDYDHAFETTLPKLMKDARGRVQIHGGSYRVTERGIVG